MPHPDLSSLNPFAMLLDPQAYAREAARSDRLARLRRRIYRPLDKPLIPNGKAAAKNAELAAYDRMVESSRVEPEELAALDALDRLDAAQEPDSGSEREADTAH